MLDDRRQVHVVDVVIPVDDAGVEAKGGVIFVVEGVPQLEQAVDAVTGVGLGVGAVKLYIAQSALGQCVPVLDARRQLRLLAPHGQRRQQSFHHGHGLIGPPELSLHPPSARERPLGHADGLPAFVVQRVAAEPVFAQLDQVPVGEGIPHT